MDLRKNSSKIKKIVIQRYLNGETAKSLAKEYNLSSLNLVMKWAGRHLEGFGINPTEYRKRNLSNEENDIIRLKKIIQSMEDDLDLALKASFFLSKGDINRCKASLDRIQRPIRAIHKIE